MKPIQYHTMNKSLWRPGPWQSEPDKAQWADPATGLPCLLKRNLLGALCGYVGVGEGHPAFGKHHDQIEADVHGGLNYAAACTAGADEAVGICHKPEPGEPVNVWWFGFDCAHFGDVIPAMPYAGASGSIYRDVDYVKLQCAHLARELA